MLRSFCCENFERKKKRERDALVQKLICARLGCDDTFDLRTTEEGSLYNLLKYYFLHEGLGCDANFDLQTTC